ncbi:hypothetical protein WLZ34_02495 [Thermogladius sp. KZ2Tp1]|uniref:hypothetical protein n=1 Tax=Thermogladius sp. KZ2Tp1 TaxID=3136289 RepID=UPI003DA935C2
MSSPLTRLIREEIWSAKLLSIQDVKLQDVQSGLESGLQAGLSSSREERELFLKILSRVVEDARTLAEFRLLKASLGVEPPTDSVDGYVLRLVWRMKKFLALLYSGSSVPHGRRLLAYFKSSCGRYRRGDVVLLEVEKTLPFYLEDCVELVERPIYSYLQLRGEVLRTNG